MIKSDKPAVPIFRVEVRPVARQNMSVQIDFHTWVILAFSSHILKSYWSVAWLPEASDNL